MKGFCDHWTSEEIEDYIYPFGILVLFETILFSKEARIIVYGKLLDDHCKEMLVGRITEKFGGQDVCSTLCNKINRFAEKWYNKEIMLKKARVINKRSR